MKGAKEILLDEVDMEQQNESSAGILSLKESVEKEVTLLSTVYQVTLAENVFICYKDKL